MAKIGIYMRALRVLFLSASILPFIAGSLIEKSIFSLLLFIIGLFAVAATHLGANLLNDYADSKSGVDAKDKTFYGFFGGSKLIQEGVLPQRFYLNSSVLFFIIGIISVLTLSIIINSKAILLYYLIIIILGFSYSHKPPQLSYRKLGEAVIFVLFGPALVMGGYFIQTQIFPTFKGFLLSLPFGFLTTAILFSNEIPDFNEDRQYSKLTWVSLAGGKNSYILYGLLVFLSLFSVVINIVYGTLSFLSLSVFICIIPLIKSLKIIKNSYSDKIKLTESSKITIAVHAAVSIIIIADFLI
ncbi:MAG: prenyltransferase [Candidatus Omnitrophota bacterium]